MAAVERQGLPRPQMNPCRLGHGRGRGLFVKNRGTFHDVFFPRADSRQTVHHTRRLQRAECRAKLGRASILDEHSVSVYNYSMWYRARCVVPQGYPDFAGGD